MQLLVTSRRSFWLVLAAFGVFFMLQCTPDERRLREGAHADFVSQAGSAGADSDAPAGEGGEFESFAGRPSGANGGASGHAAGSGGAAGAGIAGGGGNVTGGAGSGGTAVVNPGGNGTVSGGGTSGGGGANNTSGSGGRASGGAGGTFDSPCGDIDHDFIDDCSETLLVNSRFDADASHWVASPNLTQAWDARDARGKAGSGSILITNQTPIAGVDAWVMAGSDQCIPVSELTKYQLGVRVLIADGQGAGSAGLNLYAFTGDACNEIFLSGLPSAVTLARGSWTAVSAEIDTPLGSRSVLVRLAVSKPFNQDKLSALFDDVLVRVSH